MRSKNLVTLGAGSPPYFYLVVVAVVLLMACTERKTPPAGNASAPGTAPVAPTSSEPPVDEVDSPVAPTPGQRTMHDRYESVEIIREALVRGQVDSAQAAAGTLGPVAASALPEQAELLRDAVPKAAREVRSAHGLEETTRAFAKLVARCGECHQATATRWSWETPPLPEGDELAPHMARHQWAVRRMWEGLLLGSTERFDQGARALAEAPLTGDTPPDHENPPSIAGLAQAVHARATEARTARNMNERAEIFGQVLASCAQCHAHFNELDRSGVQ